MRWRNPSYHWCVPGSINPATSNGRCRCGKLWLDADRLDGECETVCQSCHRPQYAGDARYAVACGECFHVWRWRWQLVLHDAWTYWRMTAGGWRWWQVASRIRPRRPAAVFVCPCCSHDL